jgi:hypothetical protein
MGLKTQIPPQLDTNWVRAKFGYPLKTPCFMSHGFHMRDWSYKGGKGPVFTYVETTICSCKGVRREHLLWELQMQRKEKNVAKYKRCRGKWERGVDCCPRVQHWNKQAFGDWCNLRMFDFWRLSQREGGGLRSLHAVVCFKLHNFFQVRFSRT